LLFSPHASYGSVGEEEFVGPSGFTAGLALPTFAVDVTDGQFEIIGTSPGSTRNPAKPPYP